MNTVCVSWFGCPAVLAVIVLLPLARAGAQTLTTAERQAYEHADTRELVALVTDAADLVRVKGEGAFAEFRVAGSRWRQGERYIGVLDPQGNTLVHLDAAREGTNELDLKDINGRPIIRGYIDAVTMTPGRPEGWYHYQWPVTGGLIPRWKSAYIRLVVAPSGRSYLITSGIYNDRMERAFVVDAVDAAVARIEKTGAAAFPLFHDRTGPFIAKDAYVFVVDPNGTDLVNPGFPNLEGRNLLDVKDTQGKLLIREMLDVVQSKGSGWVDYMWPKPGENVSTQKSAYVSKARMGDKWVLVGSGVYLADAPVMSEPTTKVTAPELIALVREAAAALERQGEKAYPMFRERGTKWFHDDIYLFVHAVDGIRAFHAADPASEGEDWTALKDVRGRPIHKMVVDVSAGPSAEGWVHYMYPEPGNIFPTWKSTFVRRVTYPSGKQYIVGSGIYNMRMDKAFITDLVDRAAALVAARGPAAFPELRDKTGPFVFMDTYVFVDTTDGVEVVNAGQPSVEGVNFTGLKDLKGKAAVEEYIAAALKQGSAWVDYYWFKPGTNTEVRKETYVRKVQHGGVTYVVGAGLYVDGRGTD